MKAAYLLLLIVFLVDIPYYLAKTNNKNVVIDNVVDIKEFKKVLRTKTNVLVCFTNSVKRSSNVIKVFKEAAQAVKGQGTMVLIDCSGEAKKICKKLKVSPDPYILKHYKDGEFSKDYDRQEIVTSMVNFMRDPTGDLPWEEDTSANNVVHVSDTQTLMKFIKKEHKPLMVMFYAPWCGFCKTLKPEYVAAANELIGQAVLAAIDVNRPENAAVRSKFNITGFPTLLYFENGAMKYQYEGDNNKNGLINFMKNPQAPPVKIKEPEWSDTDSEVVHLTTNNFEPVIKDEGSVLIMFYAPWCGHCKRMKPDYEKAASLLKTDNIPGMLAAVDATKEQSLATKFGVKGYPTLKYFSFGELKFDLNVRESSQIVDFMRDPKEAPPPPPPEKPWAEEKSAVVHLSEEDFKPFLKKKKHVLVIFHTPWCGHCKKTKPEFTAAADQFADDNKIEFAAVDCTTQGSLCKANGVKGYPTIIYFNYHKNSKPYNGQRTEADFVKFMSNPGDTPPSPGGDSNTDLIVINDKSFKEVLAKKEPILVMFYAPWCAHCKPLLPVFKTLAQELKSEGSLARVGIVDCIENTEITEEYDITGFPTIKIFKNGKLLSDYKGKRTPENFKKILLDALSAKDEL